MSVPYGSCSASTSESPDSGVGTFTYQKSSWSAAAGVGQRMIWSSPTTQKTVDDPVWPGASPACRRLISLSDTATSGGPYAVGVVAGAILSSLILTTGVGSV